MQAILISQPGGPEVLKLGQSEQPQPGQGEILVKVHATAVNRADTLQRAGKYPVPPGASPILGLEMAGEVAAVGPGATAWTVGQRVCGLLSGGGHAEYAVIHEHLALPIPDEMSYNTAAAIPEVFLTAFQALDWLGDLQQGEKVLIHAAASGVGTAAIQLAKLRQATIMATASAHKHHICQQLGVDLVIDYRSQDFHMEVMQHTQKYGADLIVDFIAGPYFQRNLDTLAMDGRLVMLALLGGVRPEAVNLAPILRKRLRINGSTLRSRSLAYKISLTQAFQDLYWARFQDGTLAPVIDRVMDWRDIAEAHRIMEANQNAGKLVLEVGA